MIGSSQTRKIAIIISHSRALLEVGGFATDRDREGYVLVDSLQKQEGQEAERRWAKSARSPIVLGEMCHHSGLAHFDDRHDSISRNTERPIALAFML